MSRWDNDEEGNPQYPDLGEGVAKLRRKVRGSIYDIPREQRVAYADAIERAIRAKQRSALQGAFGAVPTANYGDVGDRIRAAHRASLAAYAGKVRRARKHHEWMALYEEAMEEKRKLGVDRGTKD